MDETHNKRRSSYFTRQVARLTLFLSQFYKVSRLGLKVCALYIYIFLATDNIRCSEEQKEIEYPRQSPHSIPNTSLSIGY